MTLDELEAALAGPERYWGWSWKCRAYDTAVRDRNEKAKDREWVRERRSRALALREDGCTYREIGEALDVCAERARTLVIKARRDAASASEGR